MTSQTPSVLVNAHNHNAENPLWHQQHGLVYWTDIPNGRLFRYDPTPKNAAKDYEQIYTGEPVGGFTIQADGSLLLLKTNGTVETWREGKVTSVVEEIAEVKGTRFNDAIADPEGRVFSGTMAKDNIKGRLYRIDPDGSIQEILQGLLVPNGMGFSLDYRYFYLTDSDQHAIFRFDYDRATGHISNQQSLIKIPTDKGVPDGMTVDSEGYIWSARWNGSAVYRYSPEGQEVLRIDLPTPKVSCVAFGGADYHQLLISTAREGQAIAKDNVAGELFHLRVAFTGQPELLSRIGL